MLYFPWSSCINLSRQVGNLAIWVEVKLFSSDFQFGYQKEPLRAMILGEEEQLRKTLLIWSIL